MFLQCLMGCDSLNLHGPFLLCRHSLEQTLTPMRHHKPVLLGIVHYGSWQSATQSVRSREDLEKGALHSDTINHNCHKGFALSKYFGLTGSLFWRQCQDYPSDIKIFCNILLLKNQFSKEIQFFLRFSGQKYNVSALKMALGCLSV